MEPPAPAPRVSIGLPVYNGERYIAAALDALLGQTFADFEIIVCDNASTDATVDICLDYAERDPRVSLHRSERNIGAAPNFNRAFDLASGRYFKWAAHDDLHEAGYLEACVDVLERDPEVVLCHTDVHWIDDESRFMRPYDPELEQLEAPSPHVRFRDLIIQPHFCFDVFGLIRRDVLARTPRIASYTGSDRNLLAELGLWGRLHRVRQPLFLSRDHGDRSIRSMHPWQRSAWFDSRLAGRIMFPHWRNLGEYSRSVGRVPLSTAERLRCRAVLPGWMWRNKRLLWIDCRAGGRAWLERAGLLRPRPSDEPGA